MRSTATIIYVAIFFFLCMDFGNVGYNNFLGAVIVGVYLIPAVYALFMAFRVDRYKAKHKSPEELQKEKDLEKLLEEIQKRQGKE